MSFINLLIIYLHRSETSLFTNQTTKLRNFSCFHPHFPIKIVGCSRTSSRNFSCSSEQLESPLIGSCLIHYQHQDQSDGHLSPKRRCWSITSWKVTWRFLLVTCFAFHTFQHYNHLLHPVSIELSSSTTASWTDFLKVVSWKTNCCNITQTDLSPSRPPPPVLNE